MEKTITYLGQKAKVGCDEKCDKAWGIGKRPRIYPEIGEGEIFGFGFQVNGSIYPDPYRSDIDPDNYAYLSDGELGIAPSDTGTYEGGQSKPKNKSEIPNKWCVRECERCVMSAPNEYNKPLPLKDFSKRRYNIKKMEDGK